MVVYLPIAEADALKIEQLRARVPRKLRPA
jgi:hypothetical protein